MSVACTQGAFVGLVSHVTSLSAELGLVVECQTGIQLLFNDSGSLTGKNDIQVVHFLRCVYTDFLTFHIGYLLEAA